MIFLKGAAIAVGAVLMGGVAGAADIGSIEQTAGSDGDLIVVRGGETFVLTSGDDVLSGDRIVVRNDGRAVVSAFGCDTDMTSGSTITVSDRMCDEGAVGFGYAQGETKDSLTLKSVLIAGGLVAIPVGIGLAADDDDDNTPVSP